MLAANGGKSNVDRLRPVKRPDARPDLRRLVNKRRVLTISLMINNIDGFTEAGFTFHAGNGPGKGPTDGDEVMIFRALWLTLNDTHNLLFCRCKEMGHCREFSMEFTTRPLRIRQQCRKSA